MRNFRRLFKLKQTAWSLIGGLMLAGLLGGCQTPFIDIKVQVDTCPPGGAGRSIPIDPPIVGACTPTPPLTDLTDPNLNNNGYFNTATKTTLFDHIHRCNASTWMCQSNPGSTFCGGINKVCKTRFTPTSGNNGNCLCGCPS